MKSIPSVVVLTLLLLSMVFLSGCVVHNRGVYFIDGNGDCWSAHVTNTDDVYSKLLEKTNCSKCISYEDSLQGVPFSYTDSWGKKGSGQGEFNLPSGVTADTNGNIFISDSLNHRIQKFSRDGSYLTSWGSEGQDEGQFNGTTGVASDSSGNVLVVDTLNNRIQKFSSDGTFLSSFGQSGNADGQFSYPLGIVVDNQGNIYISDSGNNRIQKLSSSGSFIQQIGSGGTGEGMFSYPTGIAVDQENNIYVLDSGEKVGRVQKFSSEGTYLTQWGTFGKQTGQFIMPVGIATDSQNNVYIADTGNDRVQVFTSSGEFLASWGYPGPLKGQLLNPMGIAVSSVGEVFVTDSMNGRIQVFKGDLTTGNPKPIQQTGTTSQELGPPEVMDYTPTTAVKNSLPVDRRKTFSVLEDQTYFYARIGPLHGGEKREIVWYDPEGNEIYRNQFTVTDPTLSGFTYWKYYDFSALLYIKGKIASSRPGIWTVKVFLDGKNYITDQFVIE